MGSEIQARTEPEMDPERVMGWEVDVAWKNYQDRVLTLAQFLNIKQAWIDGGRQE
jgi:hypothetical protein